MSRKNPSRVYVIATQHLDVAWLWNRRPHGEELMRMVLELALDLANREGSFVMSRSTAWGFSVVEKRNPDLFRRVQQAVADGRIEIAGGQWVEPDNLIPSGESQIRQGLYGRLYYKSRFGRSAEVAWNPDVFGHGNSLPAIYRQVGLEGYYFHRMLPENEAGEPIGHFIWEAPDGSQVFCFAGNWIGRPDQEALERLFTQAPGPDIGAVAAITGLRSDRRMTITEDWLGLPAEMAERLGLDECRWATSADMLDELRRNRESLPVIRGDLGGYSYTGTYTSDQITKRFNRRLENRLAAAELLDVWATAVAGSSYAEILAEAWRNLCLNQFHDIICGTCYRSAQEEAHALYREIDRSVDSVIARAAESLADRLTTDEQPGVPVVVWNASGLPRTEPVTVTVPNAGGSTGLPWRVVSAEGQELPSQPTAAGRAAFDETPRVDGSADCGESVRFVPAPIAAYGYRVFYLQKADAATVRRDEELVLENELVRVAVDRSYGSITSFYDKRTETEYVKVGGRFDRIVVYEDRNDYPASVDHFWDPWYIRLTGKEYDPQGAYTVRVVESGPASKTIRVTRSFRAASGKLDTVLIRDLTLADAMVTVHMHGDWQAERAIVRAEFDLSYTFDSVTCDMPYGVIERPAVIDTVRSVGTEAAEDRVLEGSQRDEPDRPMQMWIDVSDGAGGLAILNNGKYGYTSTPESIGLSLMRAPLIGAGEVAGLGPFEFSYALLPHPGTWREADVPGQAIAFNREPIVLPTWAHEGVLPAEGALFSVDDPAVQLTAVKRAETSTATVVRLYESSGTARTVRLESLYSVGSARQTDATEDVGAGVALPVTESAVELTFRPHEIKTVVLELGASPHLGIIALR